MRVDGKSMRSIWLEPDGWSVGIIDQTALPHRLTTARLINLEDVAHAISAMLIRGAPLIGATAAYGVCLALRADASDEALERACATLLADSDRIAYRGMAACASFLITKFVLARAGGRCKNKRVGG